MLNRSELCEANIPKPIGVREAEVQLVVGARSSERYVIGSHVKNAVSFWSTTAQMWVHWLVVMCIQLLGTPSFAKVQNFHSHRHSSPNYGMCLATSAAAGKAGAA